MHSVYPETKAVILSGFSEFSYATGGCPLRGAADYLTKPVNLKEVEGLLDRLKGGIHEAGRQDNAVRSSRVEGFFVCGQGYGDVKAEDYGITMPDQWYGLAVRLLDQELPEQEIW